MDALRLVSLLNFRPGVLKTLILLPCSSCQSDHGYEMTSESLLERHVTIHVLTNAEFRFIKHNVSRQFLARLPRSLLGVCAPIALEANGTIFAVSRLCDQRKNSGDSKRALSMFGLNELPQQPTDCQKCTCNLKN
ncbi:hypothetical protein GHT06_010609 [Daphnia sinensis]|uniref:Uncharacterized protein n=1 Tax=Daphnia sinensis TaxID=1820382 RepID=A0AAD5KYR2_9CRUS|nr:hypothetical protein GHT06_010609 [Daphnia sinensis]